MDNSHKSPAPACSGGRVYTLQHQNVLEIARNFAQNSRPTRRFEILRLLNLGAQGFGLTRAERTYLFFLVDKTQERDWSDGAPIVWWSVQRLADSLGVSARQVNRPETSLDKSHRQRLPHAPGLCQSPPLGDSETKRRARSSRPMG